MKPSAPPGHYKLLENSAKVAAAWFYVAEQTRAGSPPRRVEVIKLGMDTKAWWRVSRPNGRRWR